MQQHPIPHNIMDVEFKLFGKFTVKQFVIMAMGVGTGSIFMFMASDGSFPFGLGVFLFILFSALGLGLGLLRMNEQSADTYIKNFIIAIRAPTIRVWKNKDFDSKVESMAAQMGLAPKDLDAAKTKELLEPALKKSGTRIIGGNTTKIHRDAQQEPQPQQVQQDQPTQSASLSAPQPAPPSTPTSVPTPPSAATPVQPKTSATSIPPKSDRIVITTETVNQYAKPINGFAPQQGTINLLLVDENDRPVSKALVVVKLGGRPVLAKQTGENGLMIGTKQLKQGEYDIVIKHDKYIFPEVTYVLGNDQFPIVRIKGKSVSNNVNSANEGQS